MEPTLPLKRWTAVAGSVGGCGVTTLASTLATRLARPGQHVLLVDLCPWGTPTLRALTAQGWHPGVDAERGLPRVTGASEASQIHLWQLTPTQLQADLGELVLLAGGFDHVVVDLGMPTRSLTREIMGRAESTWWVTPRTAAGVAATRDVMVAARQTGTAPRSARVVVSHRGGVDNWPADALVALALREEFGVWAEPCGVLDAELRGRPRNAGLLSEATREVRWPAAVNQPPLPGTQAWLLGVGGGAAEHEVHAAYRRLWEALRRDGATDDAILPAERRADVNTRLDDAHSLLARRASAELQALRPAAEAPAPRGPGRRIREAREARRLGQRELSLETRIGIRYLEAIEAMDIGALPRPVYLRAYIREVARALGLDEDALVDEYLLAAENLRGGRILRSRNPQSAAEGSDEQDYAN